MLRQFFRHTYQSLNVRHRFFKSRRSSVNLSILQLSLVKINHIDIFSGLLLNKYMIYGTRLGEPHVYQFLTTFSQTKPVHTRLHG